MQRHKPKSKTHRVAKRLRAQLEEERSEVVLTYRNLRSRIGLKQRDSKKLEKFRAVAREHGVLLSCQVNGQKRKDSPLKWSSYDDNTTKIVFRLKRQSSSSRKSKETTIRASDEQWITDETRLHVEPAPGQHPYPLHPFQRQAIQHLQEKLVSGCAGILVLPTGGGKTRTTVDWLLREVIEKDGKVLWLAHRHELIDQACNAFCQLAYRGDNISTRKKFICRKVSGRHARPVDIHPDDDVVISSVQSLARGSGLKKLFERWSHDRPVCLVIDEAHHAPAQTYRKVIDGVWECYDSVRMLGLTATPYRTAHKEHGLLKKLFPDDIVYKVDLTRLIQQGFLARPQLENVSTGVDFELDDEALSKLVRSGGDFGALGKDVALAIGRHARRNRIIAEHYQSNQEHYGRTIIFAINIAHAVSLAAVLKKRGVNAEYVVSGEQDAKHHVSVGPQRNSETIARFKGGKIDVLVNVNILTEGFDDPLVRSVFLARPTMSSTLLMQMIGRTMRGPQVGGTDVANIVSFIDDWEGRIRWTSPRELVSREAAEFATSEPERRKTITRLVLVSFVERCARVLDSRLGGNAWGDVPFINRIPSGVYSFTLLDTVPGALSQAGQNGFAEDNIGDQTVDILVFDQARDGFRRLVEETDPDAIPRLGTKRFDGFAEEMREIYFDEIAGLPVAPAHEDVGAILAFIKQFGEQPQFYDFDDREKYDVNLLAQRIIEHDMGLQKQNAFLKQQWESEDPDWKQLFDDDFEMFRQVVIDRAYRAVDPEGSANISMPNVVKSKKQIEDCSLAELHEHDYEEWCRIRDAVYAGARDRKRKKFVCAETGEMRSSWTDFQIDHIKPRAEGGKTRVDNLRLVLRHVNARKGAKWDGDAHG